jgi:hypothetical protein
MEGSDKICQIAISSHLHRKCPSLFLFDKGMDISPLFECIDIHLMVPAFRGRPGNRSCCMEEDLSGKPLRIYLTSPLRENIKQSENEERISIFYSLPDRWLAHNRIKNHPRRNRREPKPFPPEKNDLKFALIRNEKFEPPPFIENHIRKGIRCIEI